MKFKFLRVLPLLLALIAPQAINAEDEVPCVVVVTKDGNTDITPVANFDKIQFNPTTVAVVPKEGPEQEYKYSAVNLIKLNEMAESSVVKTALQEEARLVVWPTVTSSIINVGGTEASDRIMIFNLQGQRVFSTKSKGEVTEIDITPLAAGHYVLTAGKESVRIIKK